MRPSPRFLLSPAVQCAVLIFASASISPVNAQNTSIDRTQAPFTLERARLHDSDQWREVERHLADPRTASAKVLEQQADILRARRFPEDALDYYRYALARGGNPVELSNRMGLTHLEMKNFQLAEASFRAAVKLDKKSAEGWNNLGAAQFIGGSVNSSISAYKRAIKLNKHEAVYHANLATAFFNTKNFSGARKELAEAMKLDPDIFNRKEGAGGLEARVLSAEERARFSFEMAKLYAQNGLEDEMLHSLARASESGMDLSRELRKDAVLGKYLTDPRVVVIIQNAELLRGGHPVPLGATASSVQPLKPS